MDYSEILSGIFPSITTPFVNGKADYGLLGANVEKYNGYDLGGYMILGGNGEYLGLTLEESIRAAQTIVWAKKPGRPVVAGAGRESAEATLEFIRIMAGTGADIASVITPFYYAKHMTDDKLAAYFEKIADESPIPVLIYNSPSYAAGVQVSPETAKKLSRHENIAGMKNSSTREITDYAGITGKNARFWFHAGRVQSLCRDLEQEAVGATLSMADYWPQACINVYDLIKQGRHGEAEELCAKIDKAGKAGASAYGVAGVKYAMDLAGFYGGEPRLPLTPLDEEQKENVRKSFKTIKDLNIC